MAGTTGMRISGYQRPVDLIEIANRNQTAKAKESGKTDVTKRQRDRIRNIVKKVKLLNFHDDTEISQMLIDLEIEVDKFKGERDKGIIVDKLQKISDLSKEEFLPANFNPIISDLEV